MKRYAHIFGHIYAATMLALCALPIIWMFQFFWLVPGLSEYFLVTLLVPIAGLGVGIHGLWITRDEKHPHASSSPDAHEERS